MNRRVATFGWILSFVALTCQTQGNPVNPVVHHGAATFSNSGSTSLIHQGSDRVIIHWDSFSIAAGETTRFVQPGVNSAALNRVVTGAPSAIHGSLQANGQVYLINPNGILIGPGGRVDTAGFLASTLDVSDDEFLAGGSMTFSGNSRARVTNLGTVTSIDGGDIFLIAKEVINHGTLTAEGGTVGLAGGTRVLVRAEGMDERISILPGSEDGSVTNGTAGQVEAAVAELKAAGGNEYALAVNNDGFVRATGFQRRGGKVYLGSSRGRISNRGRVESREVKVEAPEAPVINEGTIEADESIEIEAGIIDLTGGAGLLRARSGGSISLTATQELRINDSVQADNASGAGGVIRVTAPEITIGNRATLTAHGSTDGGRILIGGGRAGRDTSIANAQNTTVAPGAFLAANASSGGGGAGGEVILWADGNQRFEGSIEARGDGAGAGGFVEVSGLESLSFLGSVDTGGGNLLLDPFNYTIGAAEATAIVNALATSHVTIDTTQDVGANGSSGNNADAGDITVNSAIHYDSENHLTFLAVRHINFNASVQNRNATGGDINIVAGWDGTTAYDTATFSAVDVTAATPTLFGNGDGSVNIGDGTQALGVAVGSRSGTTNVFGHDVSLQGGNNALTNDGRFAQLGFQVSNGVAQDGTNLGAAPVVDGAITVHVRNDLSATGGNDQYNYAQLGHVGAELIFDSTIEAAATSMIEITAGNDITFTGGSASGAYAQLGQGGVFVDGNHSGTIRITSANDIRFEGGGGSGAYAQLGQGGVQANGNHKGTTTIEQANDITFTGGSGNTAYAHLGQGGYLANGNHSGTTTITTANDITFAGGSGGFGTYAQLGQGGFQANGNHQGTTTITRANDITFTGGSVTAAYAQLGQGGFSAIGNHDGTATITSAQDVTFQAGGGSGAYAQLGQGGSSAEGNHSGATTILNAHDIRFAGGGADGAYAQLGQGGRSVDGDHSGTTTISKANDITFTGGGERNAYAQLGQGGIGADGNHSGTTTITSANDITFRGGGESFAYAQLGQGGRDADGNHSGTTTITSANHLTFTGGGGSGAYAQLGQGGVGSDGDHSGTIDVTLEGHLVLTGMDVRDQYALIGHGDEPQIADDAGNTVSGDVTVRVGGNATLSNAFVGHQIDSDGTYTSGNTFVGVRGDLSADAASEFTSAPNGSGGELRIYLGGSDNVDAATMLNGTAHGGVATPNNQGVHVFGTGPYTADPATNGNFAYYSIAPDIYNYTVGADESAAIVASLAVGDVALDRNLGQFAFGASYDWDGGTQFITVDSAIHYDSMNPLSFLTTGDITFNASVQNRNDTGGDINIVAGWDGTTAFDTAAFLAEDVNDPSALYGNNVGTIHIGNGNQTAGVAVGSRSGTTRVFGYDVSLKGSTLTEGAFAQLGFRVSDGIAQDGTDLGAAPVVVGGIAIRAKNNLDAFGGQNENTYAQIGHVGADFSLDSGVEAAATSNIELAVGKNIAFTAGVGRGAYAQLGQGGLFASGNHSGAMTIVTANDVTFTGGGGSSAYAQLGHGGPIGSGNYNGAITIVDVGEITFSSGTGSDATVQLGHGGLSAEGNHRGDILIRRVGSVTFAGDVTGSSGSRRTVQLGHGGWNGDGNHFGDITIDQAGDITFTTAIRTDSFVLLGHGGTNAKGNHTGDISLTNVGDISFSVPGSSGSVRYAHLGHGGEAADGNHTGNIRITSSGSLDFAAGQTSASYTQLGHGGIGASGIHVGNIFLTLGGDLNLTAGSNGNSYAQLGHGGTTANGNRRGTIDITVGGHVTVTAQSTVNRYARIGHGDSPGDSDAGEAVSGDILLRIGKDATLTTASIGHQIDNDGTYTSGNTFVGVGQSNFIANASETLTADAASLFNSAPSGELRFYLPERTGYQVAAGALLNGTPAPAPGTDPLPNEQGRFAYGTGPYVLTDPGNFAFYSEQILPVALPPTEPDFRLPDSLEFFFDSRFIQPAGPLEDYSSILQWWEEFFIGWLESEEGQQFSEPLEFLPDAGFINTLGTSEVDD